jgi:hypothetical protein
MVARTFLVLHGPTAARSNSQLHHRKLASFPFLRLNPGRSNCSAQPSTYPARIRLALGIRHRGLGGDQSRSIATQGRSRLVPGYSGLFVPQPAAYLLLSIGCRRPRIEGTGHSGGRSKRVVRCCPAQLLIAVDAPILCLEPRHLRNVPTAIQSLASPLDSGRAPRELPPGSLVRVGGFLTPGIERHPGGAQKLMVPKASVLGQHPARTSITSPGKKILWAASREN